MSRLDVKTTVGDDVTRRADALRDRLARAGTFAVNLISSPGAGKTTLLCGTARRLEGRFRLAALVGDIATDRDAERLRPFLPAVQLTTGGACHLDLALVERGLNALPPGPSPEFLFVENVGNLVCPASFDLGEHLRVVLLAVTEGDDKPLKYPKAFRTSDLCLLTKTDLLPHLPFSVAAARADADAVRPGLHVIEVSSLSGEGLEAWTERLVECRNQWMRNK